MARITFTFYRIPEFGGALVNSFRTVLSEDGTITIRYEGDVQSLGTGRDISVAISPGGTPSVVTADLNAGSSISISAGQALLENFTSPAFPLQGEFDLDGQVLTFSPNAAGGYDLDVAISPLSIASHSLLLFPSIALSSSGRYGLAVSRRVVADATRPFDPSPFFSQARDGSPSGGDSAELTRARDLTAEVLDALATDVTPPIPSDDVALALSISVRSTEDIPNDLLSIRQQTFAGVPPGFTLGAPVPSSISTLSPSSS